MSAVTPKDADLQELRTAFIMLDADQDGRITAAEIQSMLARLGIVIREEVVFNLVRQASKSGSTLMNESEFYQWVSRMQALSQDSTNCADEVTEDLLAAFRVFDKDKNGFITKDELRLAMELIGEAVTDAGLNEMIKLADVDKDGKINYEEFVKMLL